MSVSNAKSSMSHASPHNHGRYRYTAIQPLVLLAARGLFVSFPLLANAAPFRIAQQSSWNTIIKDAEDPSLWLYLGVALALVLGGGAFAGLTIAYVSFSSDI